MIAYSLILNAPYLQLSSIEMAVSIFGNVVKVHPSKCHPNVRFNVSIHHIFQDLPKHDNLYCVEKVDCK